MDFILAPTLLPVVGKPNQGKITQARRAYLGIFQKEHGKIPLNERVAVLKKTRQAMRRFVRAAKVKEMARRSYILASNGPETLWSQSWPEGILLVEQHYKNYWAKA